MGRQVGELLKWKPSRLTWKARFRIHPLMFGTSTSRPREQLKSHSTRDAKRHSMRWWSTYWCRTETPTSDTFRSRTSSALSSRGIRRTAQRSTLAIRPYNMQTKAEEWDLRHARRICTWREPHRKCRVLLKAYRNRLRLLLRSRGRFHRSRVALLSSASTFSK